MPNRFKYNLSNAAAIVLATVFSWSCPSPIDGTGARRIEDTVKPSIVITAPVDGETYGQNVKITGTARDDGLIAELTYTVKGVLGNLATGTVPFPSHSPGATLAFSVSFSAVSFTGPISVEVRAVDWNDNADSDSVNLTAPSSSLSSFTAASDSKAVDLSWSEVPGATSYTIRWAADGSVPSASYGSSTTTTSPGYRVGSLDNGRLYTFLLSAATPTGTFWSSYVQCLPLSRFTLAPAVEGEYRAIRLEWASISGSSQFEVWRSDESNGAYVNISGLISGNVFKDVIVSEGSTYYYKIRPALDGSPLSSWNAGSPQIIPVSSRRTTSIAAPGITGKVATYDTDGAWAYVAAGADGVYVFDVSAPRAPRLAYTLATADAKDVAVAGARLFVADGSAGVRIFSLATPAAPTQTGLYTGVNAGSISVVEESSRAYVINAAGGTSVVYLDVSGAGDPGLRATYSNPNYTFLDVSAVNFSSTIDHVYVACSDNTNPEPPVGRLAEMQASETTLSWYRDFTYLYYKFLSVLVSGTKVYALAQYYADTSPPPEYSLFMLTRHPASLALAGRTATDQSGNIADLRHDPATGKVHVVDGIGIKTFDVSSPSAMTLDEAVDTPGSPTGIALLGEYAMIGTGARYFQTFDLRVPVTLSQKPGFSPGTGRSGMAMRGNRAYVAGNSLLNVLSISDPEFALPSLGQVAVSGAMDVAVSGDFAFVATAANGLRIIDISAETAPSIVGSVLPAIANESLKAIAVKGDYAYCAGSASLEIFDISDPALPVWMGSIDSEGGGMQDVAIRGSRAFVTDGTYFQPNSLKIIDIRDPAHPTLLAKALSSAVSIGPVRVTDTNAFAGDITGNGVWAVDIDPDSKTYLAEYGPADTDPGNNSFASGIALSGGYLFATDSSSGFAVVDASNPKAWDHAEPNTGFILKTLYIGFSGGELTIEGRYAFITDSSYGVRVIRLF